MSKYRKKPVVIEAWRVAQISHDAAKDWGALPDCIRDAYEAGGWIFHGDGSITIPTLEGVHLALPDDFIIKGIAGEFYPCKREIFAATYEYVED